MPGYTLIKRLITAIVIIALAFQSVGFAPPPGPLPVRGRPRIPLFADVVFANTRDKELILAQSDGRDFDDCICLKVVNNFPNVVILAKITPTTNVNVCDEWLIRLNEPGENQPYQVNETSNSIQNLHPPDAMGELELCVKARNVAANSQLYFQGGSTVQLAQVTITIMPGF